MTKRTKIYLISLFIGLIVTTIKTIQAESIEPLSAISDYVFDGDTFSARVLLKNDSEITVRVRIRSIDAPEIHGMCDSEIVLANKAKARLVQLVPKGTTVKLSHIKDDKYLGRIDADVELSDGRDVGEIMVSEKLARRYKGGHRAGWCD